MVLDVRRRAGLVVARRTGARSKYELARDEAVRAGLVGEAPSGSGGSPRRPSGRRAAAPGRPRACTRGGVGDERHRAVRGAGEVEDASPNGSAAASAWTHRRRRCRCSSSSAAGVLRAAGGEVERRPARAPWPTQPAGALGGAAADLEDAGARRRRRAGARRPRPAPPGTRRSRPRRRGSRRARPGSRRRTPSHQPGWPRCRLPSSSRSAPPDRARGVTGLTAAAPIDPFTCPTVD